MCLFVAKDHFIPKFSRSVTNQNLRFRVSDIIIAAAPNDSPVGPAANSVPHLWREIYDERIDFGIGTKQN